MIKVTYLDRSGFAVATPTAILVFDYLKDPTNALTKILKSAPDHPVIFFATHHHEDHFNPEIFNLAQDHKRLFVLSDDIKSKHIPDKGMQVAWMAPDDAIEGLPGDISVKAYKATFAGVCYTATLPDDKKIFHGGDLNNARCIGGESLREMTKTRTEFETIVGRIASESPELTIAMLSVSPETEDNARFFLEKVKVDNFVPMHFEPYHNDDEKEYNPDPECRFHCLHGPGQTDKIS